MNIVIQKDQQKQRFRSKIRVLHMPPANSTTKRVGRPPKPPFQPDPWTHPYTSHLMNELLFPQRVSKGACYLFLFPPAAGIEAPIKPSLNFLSGL